METEAQFHCRAIPVIRAVIVVIVIFSLFSCASSGQNLIKKDAYQIINKAISLIEKNERKDSIFIDTLRIYPEYIKEYVMSEEIKNLLNDREIQYMKKQSVRPLYIDIKKIKSERVFRYKKPVKKLDDKGVVILTGDLMADPVRAVYYLSKPVFTIDARYGIILVYQRYAGNWFWMYKKEDKDWVFFREIGIGIE